MCVCCCFFFLGGGFCFVLFWWMKKLLSNENKNKQHKESLKSPVDPETWIWKSWATVSHPWASWKWMIWSDKSKRAEHGGGQLTSACPELMCCNSISLKSLGQDFGCEGQKPGALIRFPCHIGSPASFGFSYRGHHQKNQCPKPGTPAQQLA